LGNRNVSGNWRLSGTVNGSFGTNDSTAVATGSRGDKNNNVEQSTLSRVYYCFYIKQLPTDKTEIDGISKERNTAYYQLGLIYKEKFKEYELATAKLEKLLQNNPEEKLVLPTL
jgi:hypothetical protein